MKSEKGSIGMKTVNVPKAPGAIGPYSHAVVAGELVFLSGQTPLDPETMKLSGTTAGEQTDRVLDNITLVLEGLGLTLGDVVKTTVFLQDMSDFTGMNEVYARRFGGHKPARSTIAARELPLNALVEIECVARLASS
jgi:2-iminobutanoate/2-iminopropanoate deaminase